MTLSPGTNGNVRIAKPAAQKLTLHCLPCGAFAEFDGLDTHVYRAAQRFIEEHNATAHPDLNYVSSTGHHRNCEIITTERSAILICHMCHFRKTYPDRDGFTLLQAKSDAREHLCSNRQGAPNT